MNERIKELALEARIAYYSKNGSYEGSDDGLSVIPSTQSLEKFAQLIVKECLDTIQRGIDNFGSANEDTLMGGRLALFYSYRNIQNRFGMGDYKDKQNLGVEE